MKLPKPVWLGDIPGYTEAQMREMYCQAIDDAIEMVAFNGGTVQLEAHIRQLKELANG